MIPPLAFSAFCLWKTPGDVVALAYSLDVHRFAGGEKGGEERAGRGRGFQRVSWKKRGESSPKRAKVPREERAGNRKKPEGLETSSGF